MFCQQPQKEDHYFTVIDFLNPNSIRIKKSHAESFLFTDENDVVSNYFLRKEKRNGLLAVFNGIRESVLPTRTKKAF